MSSPSSAAAAAWSWSWSAAKRSPTRCSDAALRSPRRCRSRAQIAAALEAAHERGLVIATSSRPTSRSRLAARSRCSTSVWQRADADRPGWRHAVHAHDSEQGVVMGTAPYMSPEQARGAQVDRRSDVWAFGCVLYEMLSGRLAFNGGSHSDIIAAILGEDPDCSGAAAATRRRRVRAADLRAVLTKDVRRRFRDVGDARLELEDLPAIELDRRSASARGGSRPARRNSMAVVPRYSRVGALLGGALGRRGVVACVTACISQARCKFADDVAGRGAARRHGRSAKSRWRPMAAMSSMSAARGSTTQLLMRSARFGATASPLQRHVRTR